MNLQEAKSILNIDFPISRIRLKKKFRELSRTCHPDVGGDTMEFVMLKSAYDFINKQDIPDFDVEFEDGERVPGKIDGWTLDEYGQGYPISEPAKTCEKCEGKGWWSYMGERRVEDTEAANSNDAQGQKCSKCLGYGLFSYPCKRCGGTGKYKAKNGKVVGECYGCKGTGRFFPKPKREYQKHVKGGRTGIRCGACFGDGYVRNDIFNLFFGIKFKTVKERVYARCPECKGAGEVKMWNPVLPRGYLGASSS